ncbi:MULTISPECIES: hypothetical protein [Nocardioides]|uniref:Uncharacterized protein n=1 Tax=Nocardioides vastitatis TaxID=2568655 RepID=A0ABW0ZB78_9ACTN|nr:hypothetical protein [Nocardioides sp.]
MPTARAAITAMTTGQRFTAPEALDAGVVDHAAGESDLFAPSATR